MNKKALWGVAALIVLVIGALYFINQSPSPQSTQESNVQTYADEQSGISFKYPSDWSVTPYPEAPQDVGLVLPNKNRIIIHAERSPAEYVESFLKGVQSASDVSYVPISASGFDGMKVRGSNPGPIIYYMFKKIDPQNYISIKATIAGPFSTTTPTAADAHTEQMFLEILPTISVSK